MLSDTIVAIATAASDSAIAIVRLSGDDAIDIVDGIFSRDLKAVPSHTITYGKIVDDKDIIDEVLVSVFRAPRTYTREDVVEINTHGGAYVTRKILALCLSKGARLALPGEFTKRAYLNGRISLAEAEAVNDLINADSEVKHRSAIKGIEGSIERLIEPLMNDILATIGTLEVNIDYPEYDDVAIIDQEILSPNITKWTEAMDDMLAKAERFRIIKDGLKTAIIGKPNVGKSSLLNALLKKDKAIVTDIAGTTRDLVEDDVDLGNVRLHLIDTAGIRKSEDTVEKIGIERSYKALEEADLIILVLDASRPIDEEDERLLELVKDRKHITVYNKTDVATANGLSISALKGDIKALVDLINAEYYDDQGLIDQDVLNNERQIGLMRSALTKLREIKRELAEGLALDIVASELYTVYRDLALIIGHEYQEDLIDHLFVNFCLGK